MAGSRAAGRCLCLNRGLCRGGCRCWLFHHWRGIGLVYCFDRRLFTLDDSLFSRACPCLSLFFRLAGLLIAGLTVFRHFVHPDTLHIVVWRLHVNIGDQYHRYLLPRLDVVDRPPLFVQQEGGNIQRQLCLDLARLFLHRLFFDDAQYRQREGFDAANGALAVTAGTDDLARFTQ